MRFYEYNYRVTWLLALFLKTVRSLILIRRAKCHIQILNKKFLFSLMLVQNFKNFQSFLTKLKNNFLITKPWVKMMFHQVHGGQPKLKVRNHIVWISYREFTCSVTFSLWDCFMCFTSLQQCWIRKNIFH